MPQSTRLQRVPSSVSPEYSWCVLVLNRFQLQGFPFCFRFPVQNVQGVQVLALKSETHVLMQLSPRAIVSLSWISPFVSCHQTSVFTPAYGSVTNVRVNSSMTTGQVLNLLLHKFRVSINLHYLSVHLQSRNNLYLCL